MHPIVAVGTVVIRNHTVLLVKRKHGPNPGLWAIPGGRVLFGESLLMAAERELREETTVCARAQHPVFIFDLIETGIAPVHFVVVDILAEYLSGEPNAGSDAADARWVHPDEITHLAVEENTRLLIQRFFAVELPALGHSALKQEIT
jgi:ADP-ribose pyrophosphatase